MRRRSTGRPSSAAERRRRSRGRAAAGPVRTTRATRAGAAVRAVEVEGVADLGGDAAHAVERGRRAPRRRSSASPSIVLERASRGRRARARRGRAPASARGARRARRRSPRGRRRTARVKRQVRAVGDGEVRQAADGAGRGRWRRSLAGRRRRGAARGPCAKADEVDALGAQAGAADGGEDALDHVAAGGDERRRAGAGRRPSRRCSSGWKSRTACSSGIGIWSWRLEAHGGLELLAVLDGRAARRRGRRSSGWRRRRGRACPGPCCRGRAPSGALG